MVANWITLARLPLLLAALLALAFGTPAVGLAGTALLLAGMLLDSVDGVVARARGETSVFGSVLDIAADRIYELVLWIYFAHAGLIPVVIPLLVIARTSLTDALRSMEVAGGTAPFRQHRTRLGRFLVASTFMRVAYSAAKLVSFTGLALATAWRVAPGGDVVPPLVALLRATSWLAVAICLLRGVPVIAHAFRHRWSGGASSPSTRS